MLEDNHCYPFGLVMVGVTDKAIKTQYATNKFRYNDMEMQNQEFSDGSGLEEYDYGARIQDPQLGIWHTIDPLLGQNTGWTLYNYALDNPLRIVDPDGMFAAGYGDPGPGGVDCTNGVIVGRTANAGEIDHLAPI